MRRPCIYSSLSPTCPRAAEQAKVQEANTARVQAETAARDAEIERRRVLKEEQDAAAAAAAAEAEAAGLVDADGDGVPDVQQQAPATHVSDGRDGEDQCYTAFIFLFGHRGICAGWLRVAWRCQGWHFACLQSWLQGASLFRTLWLLTHH